MLSIENPPPDPSSSYQFQHLNSNSDERASASQEVDLPNSDLDHHTPLPNFSIRDYVFTARSKDIKKNWPFSLKNLQLCLKHGVKEFLPPLQVSKQSLKRCMVETSSVEKGNTDNHAVLDASDDPRLNDKLSESCQDISSCRSGDENNFPSTTTSVSHSEIESLTVNRLSSSQTETFHRTSAAVFVASGPSGNNKTENTSRQPSKKCRLIVKFGGNSDRSTTEDIASNSTTVCEIMASKVCPVCKTFSSSSNTTLNAHIDQCLSTESTPQWASDSKLTRHRIKPRKTRMMVDIYSTALPCTLEELDRRNGTSWATVSCLPTREVEKTGNAETSNEGKKMRVSHAHPEDVGDVGPVYIDANGTKLRILSKFDDQPSVSKVVEDIEASKPQRGGDKGGKYISKKKKKRLAQKHHKFLKLASQSKMGFSQKAHGSQIVEEECQREAKGCEEEHRVSDQTKPSEFVTLRPWVCSKRRGLTKKTSQERHQPMRCNWHLPKDLLVFNGQSFSEESQLAERNAVRNFTNLSNENPTSSAKNDRIEKSFREVQVRKKMEQSLGRKRMGNLLIAARSSNNLGSSPMKLNSIQLGNHDTAANDSRMVRPSNSMNQSSLLSKRTFGASGGANSSDITCTPSIKSSADANAILSKRMKFSSKNMSCVNGRSSVTDAVPGKVKKLSALKKSQLRLMKKRNEKGMTCQSGVDQQYDLMRGNAKNQDEREEIADESFEMSTVLKPRRGRGMLCVSQGEEALASRTSKPSSHFFDHDFPVPADSSVGAGNAFLQKVDCLDSAGNQVRVYVEDVVVEPSSNTSDERSAACMAKSIDSEFYDLRNSLDDLPDSLRSAEDFRRLLCRTEAPRAPTEPDFVNDQEMFSAVEVGNDIVGQDSRMAADSDSEAAHGHSFPEVDPIPIPGPPGSFLPSPRDMGSEDFQGTSSLTTSRVHSSLDQHDAVDGDSSDSPMSAASTISNSTADRCNFNYSEPSSSVGPYDKIRSAAASVESSLQSVDTIPQASGVEVERTGFDGGYLKLDRMYVEKGSLSFKNDQPCCCQRKERFSHGVALNFQESQLLRRRKLASMTIPTGGKQMDINSNLKFANLDVRSEFVPPSSCPNPVIKPLAGTISFWDSPSSAGVKLLARSDSGSASPSASNPVLRLMGKNLLVVNKDDTSVPVGGVQPHIQNNPQTSQFLANFSEASPGNIHNPLNHIGPQASVIFDQSPHKPVGQYYDGGLLNSFNSRNAQLPAGMFQDQHMDYSFATPRDYSEFKGDYNMSGQHIRFKNRPDHDNMEKIIAAPDSRHQHPDSPQNPVKAIIIIDGVPDSENAMLSNVAKYGEGGSMPVPTASTYNLNRGHPFSCYQSQDESPVVESPLGRNANYHTTPSKLGNTRTVRWGCTSEGSGVVQQRSPFTVASSPPGHMRSTTLHYSPGFS